MRICVGTRTLVAKTCIICRELKMAEEYGWVMPDGTPYRDSNCKRCKNQLNQPINAQKNAESRRRATKGGDTWTEKDFKLLTEMTEEGRPAIEIAQTLGRSRQGIYAMRNKKKET